MSVFCRLWQFFVCPFWSFDRKTYTWSSPKSSRSWNPADFRWNQMFQKSDKDVSAKTLLILQGLGWISPEIRRISCEIERPLQGTVTLCFSLFFFDLFFCSFYTKINQDFIWCITIFGFIVLLFPYLSTNSKSSTN